MKLPPILSTVDNLVNKQVKKLQKVIVVVNFYGNIDNLKSAWKQQMNHWIFLQCRCIP